MAFGAPTPLIEMPVSWSLDDYPHFEFLRTKASILPGLMNANSVLDNWVNDYAYMQQYIDWGILTYTFHPFVIAAATACWCWKSCCGRCAPAAPSSARWRTRQPPTTRNSHTDRTAHEQHFHHRRRPRARLLRRRLHRSLAQARHAAAAARGDGQFATLVSMGTPAGAAVPRGSTRSSRPRPFRHAETHRRFFAGATDVGCDCPARPGRRREAHIVGNSAGGYVSQQVAIHHPERVKTLSLFGATPGLKHSHAPTWVPKIKEMGLKPFLASTIDERFDETADPELVKWFIEQAGDPTTRPSSPASSFICAPTTSWTNCR